MTKRMILMLAVVGVLFGGIFGFQWFKNRMMLKFMAAQGLPVETVSATKVAYEEWQPRLQAVGSLRAVRGADIAPEVAGVVAAIHFNSGDEVKAGAPLLDLNADAERAQLAALEAAAELARITLERDRKQFEVKAVSRATLDADEANLKSARAQVAQQQALLDKKLIRAPFSGKLGVRAVDLGQYLAAGTRIVTLQALDPLFVDFLVPQSSLALVEVGRAVTVRTDAFPNQTFNGRISAVDSRVDPTTRNVQVRATVRNPGHRLLPGMFVTVEVAAGAPQRLLTLPQTAITYNSFGNTVFVLEEKKQPGGKPALVAEQRFVVTGATRGDQIAILSGLKEGETVVTAGQLKLRTGTPVVINNAIEPPNDPAPRPQDE